MTTDKGRSVGRSVDRWCAFYTRGLPADIAAERREELAADVRDQLEWGATRSIPAKATARAIRWRAIRGVPSDLAWRHSQLASVDQMGAASVVFGGSLLAVATLLGLGLFGLALVAVLRGAGGIPDGDPPTVLTLVAGLAIACGLVQLARARTRPVGALWIAISAPVVLIVGLAVLARHTTLLLIASQTTPLWTLGQVTAAVCVGVLYLAAAAWWAPDRAKADAR